MFTQLHKLGMPSHQPITLPFRREDQDGNYVAYRKTRAIHFRVALLHLCCLNQSVSPDVFCEYVERECGIVKIRKYRDILEVRSKIYCLNPDIVFRMHDRLT
jgi:hypothetical protein